LAILAIVGFVGGLACGHHWQRLQRCHRPGPGDCRIQPQGVHITTAVRSREVLVKEGEFVEDSNAGEARSR
jgi:hypothetical protein